ncbi:MAG: hypothetical protein H6741_32965 [Alphaproteobacteria bacterium]|nr:hypothetical protein [Alphaproteobacteria bacterium]
MELSEAERAELEAFRGQVAAQAGMAYLLSPEQRAIEARLRLDEVSWHLRMRHEGALVGALRLIPVPLRDGFALELSRPCCCWSSTRASSSPGGS